MYKTCANRNHLKIATLGSSSLQRYWISNSFKMSGEHTQNFEINKTNSKACWDIYYNRKMAYEELANDIKALNMFKTSWVRIPTLANVTKINYDWTQPITSSFVRSRLKPTEKAFQNVGVSVDTNVIKPEVDTEESSESNVVSKIADVMFNNNSDVKKADTNKIDYIDEQITLEDKRIDGVLTKHLGRTALLKKMPDFDFLQTEVDSYNRFYDHIDGLEQNNAMEVYVEPKKDTQTEQKENIDSSSSKQMAKLMAITPDKYDQLDRPDMSADIEEVECIEIAGPFLDRQEHNQPNLKDKSESVAKIDGVSDLAKVEKPLSSNVNKPKDAAAAATDTVIIAENAATDTVSKQTLEEQVVQIAQSRRIIPEGGIYLSSKSDEEAKPTSALREMFRVEINYDSFEPRTVVIENMQPN